MKLTQGLVFLAGVDLDQERTFQDVNQGPLIWYLFPGGSLRQFIPCLQSPGVFFQQELGVWMNFKASSVLMWCWNRSFESSSCWLQRKCRVLQIISRCTEHTIARNFSLHSRNAGDSTASIIAKGRLSILYRVVQNWRLTPVTSQLQAVPVPTLRFSS